MNSIYAKAQRTLSALQQDVQQLDGGNQPSLSGSIAASMTTLQRHIRDLQDLVKHEISPEKRQDGKEKLGLLEDEYASIQKTLETHRRKQEEKMQQQREREELLRAGGNTLTAGSSIQFNQSGQDAHQRIHSSVQRSINQVDQYIDMSMASLQKLNEQGYSLKAAQRKMLDVANTLGLSQTVIRWIERRTAEDKYIFWGGVLVTVTVMYFAIKYLL